MRCAADSAVAGVNKVTVAPLFQSKEAKQQIKVCNSSGGSALEVALRSYRRPHDTELVVTGIHSLSIPQWIVAMIVNRELGSFPCALQIA